MRHAVRRWAPTANGGFARVTAGTVDAEVAFGARCRAASFPSPARTAQMKDLVFVVVTAVFFAVSWFYAKSFDRL